MKKYYRVVIPPTAKESLRDIIEYIKKDSPTAAIKVRRKLIETAKSLNESQNVFQEKNTYRARKGIIAQSLNGIIKLFTGF